MPLRVLRLPSALSVQCSAEMDVGNRRSDQQSQSNDRSRTRIMKCAGYYGGVYMYGVYGKE
jgi:hypothetical protein